MSVKKKTLFRSGIAGAGAAALFAGSWAAGLGGATAGAAEPAAPQQAAAPTAADPHSDVPLGYAAEAGGTTGGFGADVVHEYLLSEYAAEAGYSDPGEAMYDLLNQHRRADADEGLVIHVDTTVEPDNLTGNKMDVKDVSNVSILGVGDSAEFDGAGIKVTRADNIIIRNLDIHHVRLGDGDAITVTEGSHHVWIDHNTFSSTLDVDKDYYDGLVDITHNSEYVTVSWNHFHDHWKGMLVGHNDSAGSAPDKITYHHNHFERLNTRIPLIRHADVHFANNLLEDIDGSAINARMGSQVLVEGNWFENVGSGEDDSHAGYPEGPVGWWYGSNSTGYWNLVDNAFVDSPHEHLESTTDFTPPYAFDADSPADAKAAVEQYAGAGVIDPTP
ncbi:pectate lyase family protein [Streptomyces lonarensis]|uniref:Pectate lyase domain-containing protein n=1 Tax=Streptomyces lonarensis TaxID=700599 RepID=A0A7X6D2F2_9ACTN|nr:right-handed parallel beta-helix repeat-containing protein [Streptomyces lonarensis]NJQ06882.1 hypothetical protein [Streptomyces lonarensis]